MIEHIIHYISKKHTAYVFWRIKCRSNKQTVGGQFWGVIHDMEHERITGVKDYADRAHRRLMNLVYPTRAGKELSMSENARSTTQVQNIVLWLIECRTGCTCCSDENHHRGPYRSKKDAERRVTSFLDPDSKYWPLASQYALRGRYFVERMEAEPISNGRIIVDDRVIDLLSFIDVREDGTVDDNKDERLDW